MKLNELSNGKIKTGVYHAKKSDGEREQLQRLWWKGDVQVVCAVRDLPHVYCKVTYVGSPDYR